MTQSRAIVEALKRSLKAKGMSYRDLARHLRISEPSVKRTFSKGTFTLDRLERSCEALGIELHELTKMARGEAAEITATLNERQERALADDVRLFSFFYLLLTGVPLAQVRQRFRFTEIECDRFLLKLDRLRLIALGEKQKFRLMVSQNVHWLRNGPLHQRHGDQIKQEFLRSNFDGPFEKFRLLNGHLSETSIRLFQRKLDRLIAEFVEAAELDRSLPTNEGRRIWLILAFRPWTFSQAEKLRRT